MASSTLAADSAVLEVLRASLVDESGVTLQGQLDRQQYQHVNKFLECSGAKWNKSAKRHIFITPGAHEKLAALLETGIVRDDKKHFQQFYTPAALAQKVVHAADIKPGMDVNEPSAGYGALALEARTAGANVWCFEIDPAAHAHLKTLGFHVVGQPGDFLSQIPIDIFPRIVMNPPFTKDQDLKHVMHAFRFLAPDGSLTAIISPRFRTSSLKIHREFREFLSAHGRVLFEVPAGTFRESGTDIATIVIQLVRRTA